MHVQYCKNGALYLYSFRFVILNAFNLVVRLNFSRREKAPLLHVIVLFSL